MSGKKTEGKSENRGLKSSNFCSNVDFCPILLKSSRKSGNTSRWFSLFPKDEDFCFKIKGKIQNLGFFVMIFSPGESPGAKYPKTDPKIFIQVGKREDPRILTWFSVF